MIMFYSLSTSPRNVISNIDMAEMIPRSFCLEKSAASVSVPWGKLRLICFCTVRIRFTKVRIKLRMISLYFSFTFTY